MLRFHEALPSRFVFPFKAATIFEIAESIVVEFTTSHYMAAQNTQLGYMAASSSSGQPLKARHVTVPTDSPEGRTNPGLRPSRTRDPLRTPADPVNTRSGIALQSDLSRRTASIENCKAIRGGLMYPEIRLSKILHERMSRINSQSAKYRLIQLNRNSTQT